LSTLQKVGVKWLSNFYTILFEGEDNGALYFMLLKNGRKHTFYLLVLYYKDEKYL